MVPISYAKQVIKLDFPDLSEDPEKDPIWVVIKNPKLLPPKMLRVSREAQAAAEALRDGAETDGADADRAMNGTHEMAGRLVVAWRVYDPSSLPDIDPFTGEQSGGNGQQLLPSPSGGNGASGEQFGNLPTVIQVAVLKEITEAVNPQAAPDGPIQKTSSGSPSPSTTAPGAEGQ